MKIQQISKNKNFMFSRISRTCGDPGCCGGQGTNAGLLAQHIATIVTLEKLSFGPRTSSSTKSSLDLHLQHPRRSTLESWAEPCQSFQMQIRIPTACQGRRVADKFLISPGCNSNFPGHFFFILLLKLTFLWHGITVRIVLTTPKWKIFLSFQPAKRDSLLPNLRLDKIFSPSAVFGQVRTPTSVCWFRAKACHVIGSSPVQ